MNYTHVRILITLILSGRLKKIVLPVNCQSLEQSRVANRDQFVLVISKKNNKKFPLPRQWPRYLLPTTPSASSLRHHYIWQIE